MERQTELADAGARRSSVMRKWDDLVDFIMLKRPGDVFTVREGMLV